MTYNTSVRVSDTDTFFIQCVEADNEEQAIKKAQDEIRMKHHLSKRLRLSVQIVGGE